MFTDGEGRVFPHAKGMFRTDNRNAGCRYEGLQQMPPGTARVFIQQEVRHERRIPVSMQGLPGRNGPATLLETEGRTGEEKGTDANEDLSAMRKGTSRVDVRESPEERGRP